MNNYEKKHYFQDTNIENLKNLKNQANFYQ